MIADDVALQELRSSGEDKLKQFIFYDKMKCFFESQGAFARLPDHLAISGVEEMENVDVDVEVDRAMGKD